MARRRRVETSILNRCQSIQRRQDCYTHIVTSSQSVYEVERVEGVRLEGWHARALLARAIKEIRLRAALYTLTKT
jgi:hypothetical protein